MEVGLPLLKAELLAQSLAPLFFRAAVLFMGGVVVGTQEQQAVTAPETDLRLHSAWWAMVAGVKAHRAATWYRFYRTAQSGEVFPHYIADSRKCPLWNWNCVWSLLSAQHFSLGGRKKHIWPVSVACKNPVDKVSLILSSAFPSLSEEAPATARLVVLAFSPTLYLCLTALVLLSISACVRTRRTRPPRGFLGVGSGPRTCEGGGMYVLGQWSPPIPTLVGVKAAADRAIQYMKSSWRTV